MQYYDTDWEAFVDVEDYTAIADRMKLRCNILSEIQSTNATEQIAARNPVSSIQMSSDEHPASHSQWPMKFEFPVEKLPSQVHDALDKQLNLCHPKHRYLRGLMLRTLCDEAVKLKSHPDHNQKVDMAKSIILQWPYLTEQIGRGFDGWLASITDCLKSTRRHLGMIDKARSAAILNRKRRATAVEPRNGDCANAEPGACSSEVEDHVRGQHGRSSQDECSLTVKAGASSSLFAGQVRGNVGQSSSARYGDIGTAEPRASSSDVEGHVRGNGQRDRSSQDECRASVKAGVSSGENTGHVREYGGQHSSSRYEDSRTAEPGASSSDVDHVSGTDERGRSSQDECSASVKAGVSSGEVTGRVREYGGHSSSSRYEVSRTAEPGASSSDVEDHVRGNGQHGIFSPGECSATVKAAASSVEATGDVAGNGSQSSNSQDEDGAVSGRDIVQEMKLLWAKAGIQHNPGMLKLMAESFHARRSWLYSSCTNTLHLKDMYPALFCRSAIVQEFALMEKDRKCMQMAEEKALLKTPRFIHVARKQVQLQDSSKKLTVRQRRLSEILRQLDLALEQTQDEDVAAKHRAVAGMLLMPHILGDNSCYLYSTYEVYSD